MPDEYSPGKSASPAISKAPMDPARCKAGVWSNERWSRYAQCQRKAGVDGWCKQHHPDVEAARAKASEDKYRKAATKHALGWYGEGLLAALIKIRDGDNDPRETAREALARVPKDYGGGND